MKFTNVADLKKHRDEAKKTENNSKIKIRIAMATCSIAAGSKSVLDGINDALKANSVDADVIQTGCLGFCHSEPTVEVTMPGKAPVVFGDVDAKVAADIVAKFIKSGEKTGKVLEANYEIA